MNTKKILLIGNGRLAKHLKHWLSLNTSQIVLKTWNRSQPEFDFNSLNKNDLVWLAISDRSIVEFYENKLLKSGCNASVVHFSGSVYDSRIFGAHPLMTFPEDLLPNSTYPQIHFAIDFKDQDLQSVLPGFQNPSFSIPAEEKAKYHALCVLAGNFPQILWSLTQESFSELKVPEAAQKIYIRQVVENYLKLGPNALTGPIVRKDSTTIQKNLNALKAKQKLHHIYKTFVEVMGL